MNEIIKQALINENEKLRETIKTLLHNQKMIESSVTDTVLSFAPDVKWEQLSGQDRLEKVPVIISSLVTMMLGFEEGAKEYLGIIKSIDSPVYSRASKAVILRDEESGFEKTLHLPDDVKEMISLAEDGFLNSKAKECLDCESKKANQTGYCLECYTSGIINVLTSVPSRLSIEGIRESLAMEWEKGSNYSKTLNSNLEKRVKKMKRPTFYEGFEWDLEY